jgi:hypothetical protein
MSIKSTLQKLVKGKKFENLQYYPCIGLTNFSIPIYTPFDKDMATIYFTILNSTELEYFIFAGSAIGMVRNRKNIPWVDDYDIIIFQDQASTYRDIVVPILKKHGFDTIIRYRKNDLFTSSANISDYPTSWFEIFTSSVDKNGMVKCLAPHWGKYNKMDIDIDMVKPAAYYEFDDMGIRLPFFNKIEEDIKKEYGDVINVVDIHKSHCSGKYVIKDNYKKVYHEWNEMLEIAKNNTIQAFSKNKNKNKNKNKLVIDKKFQFSDRMSILQYICDNDIGLIEIMDDDAIKFTYSIKFYFPNIQIIFFMDDDKISPIELNKVDIINVTNNDLLNKYNNNIIYVNKPQFNLI